MTKVVRFSEDRNWLIVKFKILNSNLVLFHNIQTFDLSKVVGSGGLEVLIIRFIHKF